MGTRILLKGFEGLIGIVRVVTALTRLVATSLITALLTIAALTGLARLITAFTRLTGLIPTTLLTAKSRTTTVVVATLPRLVAPLTGLTGLVAIVVATRPWTVTGTLGCIALQTCTETFRTEAALILFMIVVTRTLIGWTLSVVNARAR